MNTLIINTELIIAIGTIFTSIIALIISLRALREQQRHNLKQNRHNQLLVKPIGDISFLDFEDSLSVRLWNRGIGPLIKVEVCIWKENKLIGHHLTDLLPTPPSGRWSFYSNKPNFTLLPGKYTTLLSYEFDLNTKVDRKYKKKLRKELSQLKITFKYTDVYESFVDTIERDLKWFSRYSRNKSTPEQKQN